jgi:hypothetical protein
MEARCQGELEKEFKPLRRGWCLGSKAFRAEMLQYIDAQKGKWHYGAELRESVGTWLTCFAKVNLCNQPRTRHPWGCE